MGLITGVRNATPRVPTEIADAVEKWARQWGRHARIVFIQYPTIPPVPQVRITPTCDDPIRAKLGDTLPPEAGEETVELMRYDPEKGSYVPYDLQGLGVSGVLRELKKGNTWSGSGEFDSLEAAGEEAKRRHREAKEERRREGKQNVLDIGRAVRRQVLDIPFKRAGIDLSPTDDEE